MRDYKAEAEAKVLGFLLAHGYDVFDVECSAPTSKNRVCNILVTVAKTSSGVPPSAVENMHRMMELHWMENTEGVSMSALKFKLTSTIQHMTVMKTRGQNGSSYKVDDIKRSIG